MTTERFGSHTEATLTFIVAAFLLIATLGEGGASAWTLVVLHGLVYSAVLAIVVSGVPVSWPAGRPLVAFVGFVAIAAGSALLAPYRFAAFLRFQEIAMFGAIAVFAATSGKRLLRRLWLPLLVGAAAHGAYVSVLAVLEDITRPGGTFLNPNHLAAWLVAVCLLALGSPTNGSVERAVRAVLIVLALAGLLVTASRGAMLGLASGGAALLALRFGRLGARARRGALTATVVAALLAGFVITARVRSEDSFAFHRVKIWAAAVEVAGDAPWLGVGPGQFRWAARLHAFDDDVPPMRFDRRFSNTHSDWIRAPAETGWLGALAAGCAVVLAARELVRRSRARDPLPGIHGACAALTALLAQAAVDNLSERPALMALSAVLLGSALSTGPSVFPTREASFARSRGRLARAGFAIVLVTAFVVGDVAPWRAWRALRLADRAMTSSERIEALEAAVRRNPMQPYPRARLADATVAQGPLDPERYARARELAESAVRLNPTDSQLHRSLARLEAVACVTLFGDEATADRARQAYARAARRAPRDATLPLELAAFERGIGAFERAETLVDRVLELEPNAAAAHVVRSELAAARGDRATAADSLARSRDLVRRYPPDTWENPYTRTLMRVDPDRSTPVPDSDDGLR